MRAGGEGGRREAGRLLALLPAVLAPVAVGVAFAAGSRLLLPTLATLAIYPVFAFLVLRGQRGTAIVSALLWAASLSSTIVVATARDPSRAAPLVVNGPAYRDQMFDYVATGQGRESAPLKFIPEHLRHALLFAIATYVSAGLLGLAMGAVLVGYMSFYVGSLAAGPAPHLAYLFGWPPWAVLRVVAFVILGALLARPLLERLGRHPISAQGERRLFAVVAGLLVLDMLLKGILASPWAALLRPCLPQ